MKTRALLGQKELADLLGITKQALYWRINHGQSWYGTSVPEPDYRVSATRLWTYETLKKSKVVSESELDSFVNRMNQITLDDITKSS